jgi:hypothetical protein
VEQQCVGYNRGCLIDLATRLLVTQAIVFQVDRTVCLVFRIGFVIERVFMSRLVWSQ